ncbi:MAG: hypothetical protein ABSB35_00075 [Bryobacteraceae bacterium]|jgi:general secretion pathway protein G
MRWRLATIVIVGLMTAALYLHHRSIEVWENQLRATLWGLHTALHEYMFDKQKAPRTLQDMVQEHYLREVPVDPMTGSNSTWRIVNEGGEVRVRSGSTRSGLNGKRYSDW